MKVWVVTAWSGEWSDRTEWVDSVWTTEAGAMARAAALDATSFQHGGVDGTDVNEFELDATGRASTPGENERT